MGGYTDNVFVSYLPDMEIDRETTPLEHKDVNNGNFRLANDGTGRADILQKCVYARDGWEIVPESVQMNIVHRVGNIDERTYARITESDHTKFCFEAQVYPLAREGGGDIHFYPSYVEQRLVVRVRG